MKLSEAITVLEAEVVLVNHPRDRETLDALNLAIGCLSFRLLLKDKWAFSVYDKLDGEEPE